VDSHCTIQLPTLLSELSKHPNRLPQSWYAPLSIALASGSPQLVSSVLQALSDIYSTGSLPASDGNQNPILASISAALTGFPYPVYAQSTLQITRFSLGVINGESAPDSPIHGQPLLNYFQAIYRCALAGLNPAEVHAARTALSQAAQLLAQRFESPPTYDAGLSVMAYQLSRKIIFNCLNDDLFDVLDNSSTNSPLANVYESDVLLVLKFLCSGSLGRSESSEDSVALRAASISIELVATFVATDAEVMYTSIQYLRLIKTSVCSLILRHSRSTSFPVFRATLGLCHLLVMRYRDILKAEASVFFSSLFVRVLESPFPVQFKLAVIERFGRFTPSFLGEIFVNFDCDIDLRELNVFEQIISSIVNLAEIPEAVHCLARILKQLDEWSQNVQTAESPSTQRPSQIEQTRKLKALYSKAIDDFNADPEHNLKSLVESGLVKNEPKRIAEFLHTHRPLLSPRSVGILLGSPNDFFKQIMYEYVDYIDFRSQSLCEALYSFLSMFRLPPESQQISRIIEKFSESYYLGHPSEFPSASIVYDASFAAVVLHTDAWNPHVKNKMQKAQFVRLYQDLEEGDAMPVEFVESIYDYVVSHEIQLLGSVTMTEDFRSPEQKSQDSYKQSLEHIRDAQKRMRSSPGSEIRWVSPVRPDTIRPMFEAIWMPLNALASNILSDGGDEALVVSALAIITSSIAIAARFYLETESVVCMSSLSTFTRLQSWAPIEVQNLRAIRELLEMSKTFSSYFEPVWEKILFLFAQLHSLILAHKASMPGEQSISEVARINAEIIAEYVPQKSIDELFDRSSFFAPTAIIPFVTALCKVSNREFSQHPPGTFCLQKIIEVASANMGQERGWFTWRLIWKPVSRHLVEAGCFPQEGIARAALDSLRQLAAKFLGQRELHGFRYQRDFLKPFHLILRKSKSKAIRLHSLRCLNHTVRQSHAKMKSGWETVLSMLESAATITEVNRLALTFLIDVLERNLPALIDERLLPNAVKAVSKFVIIGRNIRESALYVLAGVFEEMMKLKVAESELKPVLAAIGSAMIDVDAVLINLKIARQSIRPQYWSVVTPWVQHVILNKPERWFKRCGESLLEWAILGSVDTHPEECLRLVMQSTTLLSLRILSVCARVLRAQLSQNPGAKEAATILAQGLISSLEAEDSQDEIEFMSGLVLDLAEILDARELLGLIPYQLRCLEFTS
jgi:hypothetical protein